MKINLWTERRRSYFVNLFQGMILLSELSRRRIRSVNKLIRVGRQEIVLVLRVDKEKGVYTFLFSERFLMHKVTLICQSAVFQLMMLLALRTNMSSLRM